MSNKLLCNDYGDCAEISCKTINKVLRGVMDAEVVSVNQNDQNKTVNIEISEKLSC